LKKLFSTGTPVLLAALSEIATIGVQPVLAGLIDKDSLIAIGITLDYVMLTKIFTTGTLTTALTKIRTEMGLRQIQNIKKYNVSNISISLFNNLLLSIVVFSLIDNFVEFYAGSNVSDNVIQKTKNLILFSTLSQLFDTLRMGLGGTLYGMNDMIVPTLTDLFTTFIIGMPLAYILSSHTSLKVYGIPIANTIAFFISSIILTWRFNTMLTKTQLAFNTEENNTIDDISSANTNKASLEPTRSDAVKQRDRSSSSSTSISLGFFQPSSGAQTSDSSDSSKEYVKKM